MLARAAMLTDLHTRFHAFDYSPQFTLIGRCNLFIGPAALTTYNYAHAPNTISRYKSHELDIALSHAGWINGIEDMPLQRVVRQLTPALVSTIVHRVGAIRIHLYALGLQDLLPAITHYYLWC